MNKFQAMLDLEFKNVSVEELRKKRNNYWAQLQAVRADYFNDTVEHKHPTAEGFYYFMQNHWGLKMVLDDNNNITGDFKVIDESKYLMFIMKYGS